MKDKETHRKTGIDIIGNVPWGTHLCQFYHTKEDLIDILVPYFKVGLENNEFCMWVTSKPLRAKDAKAALQKAVNNLADYIKKGQIEILDYSDWYTKSGTFDSDKVLAGWVEKEKEAIKRGFQGLRLTGNTFWLERNNWKGFADYEETVNNVIGQYKMLAICSYSLDKCGANEIIDVVSNHQFAITRKEGKWQLIESSERRKVMQELEKSQLQYEALVQTVPDIIYEIDMDGKFIFISDSVEQLGYSPKELIGKHFREIVHLDDVENVSRSIVLPKYQGKITGDENAPKLFDERRTGKRATKALELRLIVKKQEGVSRDYCYAEIHSSGRWDRPVTDKDKKLLGTICRIGVIRDITRRKIAEEKLQTSYAQTQNIVEKNPDAIVVLDEDGNILFLNQATERMFGRQEGELLGASFGFPLITTKAVQINIVCKSGVSGIGEMRVTEVKWGDKPAYLVSIHDITELKKMEAIKAGIDERARLDKLKDEFISTVSHELRTPLTTMKEFMSIISDEIAGKLTKEQREYVDIVKGNVDRLARLINNLLDISKIESGKVELKKTLVDITNLANSVILELKPGAEEKHIEFKTLFPPAATNVHADPDKMTQVFTNLINNAIKFTPEKGKITVEIKNIKSEIECSVADTGKGIGADDMGKLFGKFQQIDRVAGAGAKGTGLGLAITKELIDLHNGRIWAESKIGKGSKFIFTLPKHTTDSLFEEYINSSIKKAMKNDSKISIIMMSLIDFEKLKHKLSAEEHQSVLKDMEKALTKELRRQDDLALKDDGEILVILSDCDKKGSLSVEGRLEKVLGDYLAGKKLDKKIKLRIGSATYPDQAEDVKKLIAKARK